MAVLQLGIYKYTVSFEYIYIYIYIYIYMIGREKYRETESE